VALRMLDRYSFICFGDGLVTKSCLTFQTLWTVICQAPLSIGFPKQEFWSGLPFSSLGDLPDLGMEATSPALQVVSYTAGGLPTLAGRFYTTEHPGKPMLIIYLIELPLCG